MRELRLCFLLFLTILLSVQSYPQSPSSSAAAGLAAGAALTAGAAQSSTSSSSAGGNGAPIEMNIMVYGGLKQTALKIAADVDSVAKPVADASWQPVASEMGSDKPCNAALTRQVLLEDNMSAAQLSTYATFMAYQQSIASSLDGSHRAILHDIGEIKRIIKEREELKKQKAEAAAKAKLKPGKNSQPALEIGPYGEVISPDAFTATPPVANSGSPSASTTPPMALTYLGDITTALGGAKSGISYSASSIQPTTQALTTELGKDLCNRGIALYSSTSPINVDAAVSKITGKVMDLASANATIQASPYTTPPAAAEDDKPAIQQLSSDITSKVSSSNQMMNSFQSWLASSDGSGNLILTDVIRGMTLQDALGTGILALQFTIDAAGGNTRTNSFFLLNLFYTPKPSFNGGVVVTYELRNEQNRFIAGDTLKVLYDYSKWRPKCFLMKANDEVNDTSLSTGRVKDPQRTGGSFVCEAK